MNILKTITYLVLQLQAYYCYSNVNCSFFVDENSSCFIAQSVSSRITGCDNDPCEKAVCSCDPYCCDVLWDLSCSTINYHNPGCSASHLCCKDSKLYSFGSSTIFGSGCAPTYPENRGDVATLVAYSATAGINTTFSRKSCNYAIPFEVESGYKLAFTGFTYRGTTVADPSQSSETSFLAEHFISGHQGEKLKAEYYTTQEIALDYDETVVTECGESSIFRIYTSISASTINVTDTEASIAINEGFTYQFEVIKC